MKEWKLERSPDLEADKYLSPSPWTVKTGLVLDRDGKVICSILDNWTNPYDYCYMRGWNDRVDTDKVSPDPIFGPLYGRFSGKNIVLTGVFKSMSRDEMRELLEKHGAKITSSVSSRTDFVIAGDRAGKKLEKAEKLGIAVVSEANEINTPALELSRDQVVEDLRAENESLRKLLTKIDEVFDSVEKGTEQDMIGLVVKALIESELEKIGGELK